MLNKILATLDISPRAQEVFETALSLAQKHKANLLLLHVLSAEEDNSPLLVPANLKEIYPAQGNDLTLESWRKQWEEFELDGLKMLQSRTQQAMDLDIKTDYQQIYGSPGRTICKVAQQWQADIIVIGRRGRSQLGEILLGSVSNYVVHHAPCSVWIVQAQKIDK